MTCRFLFTGQRSWRQRGIAMSALVWMTGYLSVFAVMADAPVTVTELNIGRQCLLNGQDTAAEDRLSLVWRTADRESGERAMAAFYLGLLADRQGNDSAAGEWYAQAKSLAADGERREFVSLMACLPKRANATVEDERSAPFLFTSMAAPPISLTPDHARSRKALMLVQAARREQPQGTLENRIKLMSAILLHAEFASSDEEDLYTLANDHFSEGVQLYEQIKKELDADTKAAEQEKRPSKLEQLLVNPNTAPVVMRWDAIQVRWNIIKDKREPASRQQERERIQRLQELVTTYRDCTGKTSLAMTEALLGDAAAAEQSLQDAETHYAQINKVATQEPRDFYLLNPEPGVDQLAKQDPDPDARIPYVATPPFGTRFAAQLKAVRALVRLQNAERTEVADEVELDAAMQLARQAIDPQQGDAANALGYYVLGRAQDARGLAKTTSGLAQAAAHKAASQDFANATKNLEKCRDLLSGPRRDVTDAEPGQDDSPPQRGQDRIASSAVAPRGPDRGLSSSFRLVSYQAEPGFRFARAARRADTPEPRVLTDVMKRLNELTGDEPFLMASRDLTKNGHVAKAFVELERGLKSRPKASDLLWYEWAQMGLRAGDANRVRALFEEARQSALIPDSHRSHLVRAKVIVACALEGMAKDPLERMEPAQRARIASDLRAIVEALEKDAREVQGVDQAMTWAHWALAVALASVADPSDESLPGRRMEAYQRAKDAHLELVREARDQPDRLDARESLVAARLALGHLSLQLTGDRGDAVDAFSTALDELVGLPSQPAAAKILGMPLLETLRAADPAGGLRRYETERQVRQAMQYFLDGAISLNFGDAAAATDQMDQGLKRLQSPVGQSSQLDADSLVAGLDSVDVQLVVPDLLRACKVLALVQRCEGEADTTTRQQLAAIAVEEAERLAASAQGVGPTVGRTMAPSRTHNAFIGISLGLALEQRGVATGLWPSPTRQQDLARARSELRRSREQLTADLKRRYPTIAKVAQEADERLNAPAYYEQRVAAARGEYRVVDAERYLQQALARYEGATTFWNQLLEVTIERADIAGSNAVATGPEAYADVSSVLEHMAKHGMGSDFQRAYWQGYVRERTGQWQLAEQSYREALRAAQNDTQKVQASSKAAFAVSKRLTAGTLTN